MIFKQLFEPISSTYTYIIADENDRSAVIIDSVREDVPHLLKLIDDLQLKVVYALDTHTHADHITGMSALQDKVGCEIVMGRHSKAKFLNRKLAEGDTLKIGKLSIKAMYTPGHTDDSYSYLLEDRVFTGDILMINATGRTDFQNGDAHAAYDSLFNKLLLLPDETLVYPAHDYNQKFVSSIIQEKQNNPRLQVKNADEYAAIMDTLNLPKPKQIDVAVPANLLCGRDPD
jgi:glyoxylase-like metal-dependent hydrolase (beta-lactamase superfamily II)